MKDYKNTKNNIQDDNIQTEWLLDWTELQKTYEIINGLGWGSYGDVISARNRFTNKIVAIKKISNTSKNIQISKSIYREISTLRTLNQFIRPDISHGDNNFIVKLLDIIVPNSSLDKIFLIFECSITDLGKIVSSNINLNLDEIRMLMYNILCGVKILHDNSIIHQDLKPSNILLNDNFVVKICDFGLSRNFESKNPPSKFNIIEKLENNIFDIIFQSPENKRKKAKKNKNEFKHYLTTTDTNSNSISRNQIKTSKNGENFKINSTLNLSNKIATKNYRAPETILGSKDSGQAIDMWSIGCIFAELLSTLKENPIQFFERKPLFRNDPMNYIHSSIDQKIKNSISFGRIEECDKYYQFSEILNILGTPIPEDLGENNNIKSYVMNFDFRQKYSLSKRFPGASLNALDLLQNFLEFSPEKRINVNGALNHLFFKQIRDINKETNSKTELINSYLRSNIKFNLDNNNNLCPHDENIPEIDLINKRIWKEIIFFKKENNLSMRN